MYKHTRFLKLEWIEKYYNNICSKLYGNTIKLFQNYNAFLKIQNNLYGDFMFSLLKLQIKENVWINYIQLSL